MKGYVSPRTADGRFAPGTSGNPHGRGAGTRSRISKRILEQLETDADSILSALTKKAQKGNVNAAKFLLSLITPRAKYGAVDAADMPAADLETAEGLSQAHASIINATATGRLDPDQAASLSALLNDQRKLLETVALEKKLKDLEARKVVKIDDLLGDREK